jgi:hypothetical protein
MNPNTSQNGARNFPRPWTITPANAAAASPASATRRATTFAPTSIPSVHALSTTPIPMSWIPSTSST